MRYKKQKAIIIFIRYSFLNLTVMFMSVSMIFLFQTLAPFLITSSMFLLISIINFKIRNHSQYVDFQDSRLSVQKKAEIETHFKFEDLEISEIQSRSIYKGIVFSNEIKSVVIWKYEFSKDNWKSIIERCQQIKPFSNEIKDIFGKGY